MSLAISLTTSFILIGGVFITNWTVEVYNLLGQKIASDDLQNTTEHLLDLSKVATGNYYRRIQDDSQQFFIKRIIIK